MLESKPTPRYARSMVQMEYENTSSVASKPGNTMYIGFDLSCARNDTMNVTRCAGSFPSNCALPIDS